MDISEILSLTPESLATTQRKALVIHVESVFKDILHRIATKDYENIPVNTSNAGDGNGDDNVYIVFTEEMDIGDIMDKLIELDGHIKG